MRSNKKVIKSLIKELENTPYEIGLAILRERLITIAEISKKGIEESPKDWNNPLISSSMYMDFCNRVINHLEFDNN
jgi:hypothetical protein